MSDSTANPVPAVAVPDEGKDAPVAVEEKKHASGLSLDQRQELCLSIGGGYACVYACWYLAYICMCTSNTLSLTYSVLRSTSKCIQEDELRTLLDKHPSPMVRVCMCVLCRVYVCVCAYCIYYFIRALYAHN
jgi:hypothetical protein